HRASERRQTDRRYRAARLPDAARYDQGVDEPRQFVLGMKLEQPISRKLIEFVGDDVFGFYAAQYAGHHAFAVLPLHPRDPAQSFSRNHMLIITQSARAALHYRADRLRRGVLEIRGLRLFPGFPWNRFLIAPFQFRLAIGASAIGCLLAVAEIAEYELAQAFF